MSLEATTRLLWRHALASTLPPFQFSSHPAPSPVLQTVDSTYTHSIRLQDDEPPPYDRSTMWHCSFTYVSLVLGAVYWCLFLFAVRYIFHLIQEPKRKAQKIFLGFIIAQCAGRALWCCLWPFYGTACEPVVSGGPFQWLDVFATMPALFFLSAFTLLTYTFARIFHTVLRFGDPLHKVLFGLFVWGFSLLNLAIYLLSIMEYVYGSDGGIRVIVVCIASFCIAAGFLLYGVLLYLDVKKVISGLRSNSAAPEERDDELSHEAGEDEDTRHSDSSSGTGTYRTSSPRHSYSRGATAAAAPPSNPMKKIAVVASICMVCFMVRSIMLPIMENQYGVTDTLMVAYYGISEILPLVLMLKVFDTKAASGTHAAKSLRPNVLLAGQA